MGLFRKDPPHRRFTVKAISRRLGRQWGERQAFTLEAYGYDDAVDRVNKHYGVEDFGYIEVHIYSIREHVKR